MSSSTTVTVAKDQAMVTCLGLRPGTGVLGALQQLVRGRRSPPPKTFRAPCNRQRAM